MVESKKEDKQPRPISDVAEPGKSAATATSKPVLVSNRPLIKDPMVVEDDANDDAKQSPAITKGSSKKIQPLDSSPKPLDDEESVPVEPPSEAEKETETEEQLKPKKLEDNEAAEAARQAERDANLQKIVEAKTYYLPINTVEKRKTKRFVVLGILLSILLIIVWLDVALDAGLIQIDGISPLTHFFSG